METIIRRLEQLEAYIAPTRAESGVRQRAMRNI